jgi:cell wall-associated NlpC family hydrolase
MLPLTGRQWNWSKSDCWTLVRDWYVIHGLILPDWDRPSVEEFENNPMFDDCWKIAGFFELPANAPLITGDALLLNINDTKPNHVAVFVGGGEILHHLRDHLSRRELYGRWLQRCTSRRLRHRSLGL